MSEESRKGGRDHRADLHKTAAQTPPRVISDSLAKPLARRFYTDSSVGDAAPFQILLDGRPVTTPKKRPLAVPTRALAEAVAEEWRAQDKVINPTNMPLTRFANTAIDAVADEAEAVAADIVAYAGSDLLCYRAEAPEELVLLQARSWDPIVAWADTALDAHFSVVAGVMHVAQPPAALRAVAKALEPHDPFRLAGLHVMTTLTGSALLTLAHARGRLDTGQAWAAAHVDEDYQISLWGQDHEAEVRRAARRAEFQAASRYLSLLAA